MNSFTSCLALASLLIWLPSSSGQSIDGNQNLSKAIDRLDLLHGLEGEWHPSVRFSGLADLGHLRIVDGDKALSWKDSADLDLVRFGAGPFVDSMAYEKSPRNVKPLFGLFYKRPFHMLEVRERQFQLLVDPVLHLTAGQDFKEDAFIFQNTRGIKIQGLLDKKVYFYTSIYENQRRFLQHIEKSIMAREAIPGQGFYKPYQSRLIDGLRGWDYLNAQAFVHFNLSSSIGLELGHGNHFIGDGLRSLLLSDYGHNYFYFKLNTAVWKLHYQNIFAELSATSSTQNPGDELLPKKYMAAHYLTLNVSSRFRIGLFESVVFGRQNNFELQYLNPIILYRSVEQFLDSPDNVLFGLNFSWNISRGVQLYGQWLLDEMRLSETFKNRGWWGNKSGIQLGLKWYDALNVVGLDFLLEHNSVRPYTYAHRKTAAENDFVVASYSHFNQVLAHPLGANFRELLLLVDYHWTQNTSLRFKAVMARYGDDPPGENWGNDIFKDYTSRQDDFNNRIGQGIDTDVYLLSLGASHTLFYNYFIDFKYLFRHQNPTSNTPNLISHYFSIGIRANVSPKPLDY